MRAKDRALVGAAAVIGAAWVRSRRRRHRRSARSLTASELGALSPFYTADLLAAVRIDHVAGLANPLGYGLARRLGLGIMLDPRMIGGMALVDTVVIVDRPGRIDRIGTLFHELVHVAQFRALGVRGFVREYVRGWVENGRAYHDIPLEIHAYELQARFERDRERAFSVEAEVESWIDHRAGGRANAGGPPG